MSAFLLATFKTYVLPKIIQYAVAWAVKHGMVNELEASLLKFGLSLKSSHDPEDFPQAPPEAPTNNHNFTSGSPPPK